MALHKTSSLNVSMNLTRIFLCLISGIILLITQSANADSVKLRLSKITPYGNIELSGSQARLKVYVPMPQRWEVEDARLTLSFTNSSSLLPDFSRLVISLNGFVLGQKKLRPNASEGFWQMDLPVPLLSTGYNTLEFRVIQRIGTQCTNPSAPELWTRLNLDASYLDLDYRWREVPVTLADAAEYIFDPKLPTNAALHIVVPTLDAVHMRLAVLAASAAAVHYDYRPLMLTISNRLVPGEDNMVISEAKFLSDILQQAGTKPPEGNMGVSPLPLLPDLQNTDNPQSTDARFVLITLSGSTIEEVEKSVQALALITFPLPQQVSATAEQTSWPAVTSYSGKSTLSSGETYTFADLGFETVTRGGLKPESMELHFRLPGGMVNNSNAPMIIKLNMAYGAGMKRESTLNVLLNKKYAVSVPLINAAGGAFQGYQLSIPMKYCKAGPNTITFDPILIPNDYDPCEYMETGNLVLTLFGDSSLKLPALDLWAALPDLALFTQSGFPLNNPPDWSDTTLVLTSPDWDVAGAALNFAAMISQKTGIPPFGIQVVANPSKNIKGNILFVGPYGSWPEDWRAASPLSKKIKYPFNDGVPALEKFKGWWMHYFHKSLPRRTMPSPLAEVAYRNPLAIDKPFLVEFESPEVAGKTVVALTGKNPNQLQSAAKALWDPALQSQLSGEVTLLDITSPKHRALSHPAENQYYVGALTQFSLLDHIAHEYPKTYFFVLALLIILFAWILLILLRRIKKRRLKTAQHNGGNQ